MRGLTSGTTSLVMMLLLCQPALSSAQAPSFRSGEGPPAAQEAGRTILRALVEDELGGILVGAQVTLLEVASRQVRHVASDEAGRAEFEGLAPGEYTVKAEATGFRTLEQRVTIGKEPLRSLRLQLKVEVVEEVNVEESRRIEHQRAAMDQNADTVPVDDDLIRGLPMPPGGQGLLTFLSDFLSPSAGEPSVYVDGMEVSGLTLPRGSIDGIVVNKNPYSPEYQQPGKARIEVVGEDGSSSHYHGDATFTFADSALNARPALASTDSDTHQRVGELGFAGPLPSKRGAYRFDVLHAQENSAGIVKAQTLGGPFTASVPERQSEIYATARLDLRKSDTQNLLLRYDYSEENERNSKISGLRLPELALNSSSIEHELRFQSNTIFSTSFVNDLRISFEHQRDEVGQPPTGPLLVVRGAFSGGVNQTSSSTQSRQLKLQSVGTYMSGSHTLRFGGRYSPQLVKASDAANFGGTFEFSSLDLFALRRPFIFRINQGGTDVRYWLHEAELYLQDEIKVRPGMTLMLGARYDWASSLDDRNNVAPRIAFAFAPGNQKTAVRAGVGMFYDSLSESAYRNVLLFDGARTRELVITNPSFPDPFFAGENRATPPSLFRFAPDLRTPYLAQATVSVEREVSRETFLTLEYAHLRGENLFRARNANAPLLRTGLRPDPAVLNVTQIESNGRLEGNEMYVTFRKQAGNFEGTAVYTYSRAFNNTFGAKSGSDLSFNLPADNYELGPEWGRADYDVRHRLSLAGVLELPRMFQAGIVMRMKSGPPYDITTGYDDNGDTEASDRPRGVTRNTGQAPGFAQLDLRMSKLFQTARPLKYAMADPGELQINIDVVNLLNRTNYVDVVGVLSSPLFGHPISAREPRSIQISIGYRF
jgi:carboxypeptidase family protein/TonB-dependent receptor-like protein